MIGQFPSKDCWPKFTATELRMFVSIWELYPDKLHAESVAMKAMRELSKRDCSSPQMRAINAALDATYGAMGGKHGN